MSIPDEASLKQLKRSKLQSLAKKHNIKANAKNESIIASLLALREHAQETSRKPGSQILVASSKTTPTNIGTTSTPERGDAPATGSPLPASNFRTTAKKSTSQPPERHATFGQATPLRSNSTESPHTSTPEQPVSSSILQALPSNRPRRSFSITEILNPAPQAGDKRRWTEEDASVSVSAPSRAHEDAVDNSLLRKKARIDIDQQHRSTVDSRPKLFREIEAEITIDEDEVDELDQDENDDEIQLLYPPESPQIYRRSPEIDQPDSDQNPHHVPLSTQYNVASARATTPSPSNGDNSRPRITYPPLQATPRVQVRVSAEVQLQENSRTTRDHELSDEHPHSSFQNQLEASMPSRGGSFEYYRLFRTENPYLQDMRKTASRESSASYHPRSYSPERQVASSSSSSSYHPRSLSPHLHGRRGSSSPEPPNIYHPHALSPGQLNRDRGGLLDPSSSPSYMPASPTYYGRGNDNGSQDLQISPRNNFEGERILSSPSPRSRTVSFELRLEDGLPESPLLCQPLVRDNVQPVAPTPVRSHTTYSRAINGWRNEKQTDENQRIAAPTNTEPEDDRIAALARMSSAQRKEYSEIFGDGESDDLQSPAPAPRQPLQVLLGGAQPQAHSTPNVLTDSALAFDQRYETERVCLLTRINTLDSLLTKRTEQIQELTLQVETTKKEADEMTRAVRMERSKLRRCLAILGGLGVDPPAELSEGLSSL